MDAAFLYNAKAMDADRSSSYFSADWPLPARAGRQRAVS